MKEGAAEDEQERQRGDEEEEGDGEERPGTIGRKKGAGAERGRETPRDTKKVGARRVIRRAEGKTSAVGLDRPM